MKSLRINLIVALIALYGCNQSSISKESQNGTVESISGNAFLQPIDKNTSLALASSSTYITAEFIDSTYCTINYIGPRSVKIDRKYSLNGEGLFKIYNPANGNSKTYKMILEDYIYYICRPSDNYKFFKILPKEDLDSVALKGNDLLLKSFLYPNLDETEQEYGAEDRYVKGENGFLRSIEHPLKQEIRKIDIFELF